MTQSTLMAEVACARSILDSAEKEGLTIEQTLEYLDSFSDSLPADAPPAVIYRQTLALRDLVFTGSTWFAESPSAREQIEARLLQLGIDPEETFIRVLIDLASEHYRTGIEPLRLLAAVDPLAELLAD